MATSMDNSNAATEDLHRAVSNLRITKPPDIDDLMKWHVYIGYSWVDREMVRELLALMQNNGLKYSVRSSLDVEERTQTDNIKQGIIFSHKCLLYISPDYLKDPNSQQEFIRTEKKLQLLGKNSVFCIVKYNVKKEQLGGYEQFQLIFMRDGQTVKECLTNSPDWNAILNDYKLDPQLSLVSKENIGVGVAYTYFFSFLQIVIPDVWNSFVKEILRPSAIKEPIENTFLLKKMLIIIPKTLLSPIKLTDDTNIKRTNLSIKQCYDRAGKERREYTIPIYKLTDIKSGNVYYFVTDIPSCLYAIREAYDSELNIMPRDDVFETRNDFVLTLKALINHPKNHSKFENQWEMLLWPDDDEDNNRMDLSEFVSQQIKTKGLAERFADVPIQPIDTKSIKSTKDCAKPMDKQTFAYAGGIRAYPMYSERPHYGLKKDPRGYCIIISNSCFLRDDLTTRGCAETEIEKLEELFRALKFAVVVERNLEVQEMLSFLKKYQDIDHTESDAFVCCILSHGSKGRIFGSDGDTISVVELMKLFYEESCPGLKGKPKLFFIGACQSHGSVAEDKEQGTTLESTSATHMPPGAGPGARSESSDTKTDASPEEFSANVVRDLIPSTVDFIVSYACLPDTKALRDEEKGGYYVQALCKHLNEDLEIDVALRYVNQEVRELWDEYNRLKIVGKKHSRPDPFHIIMPPQKFLFLNSI